MQVSSLNSIQSFQPAAHPSSEDVALSFLQPSFDVDINNGIKTDYFSGNAKNPFLLSKSTFQQSFQYLIQKKNQAIAIYSLQGSKYQDLLKKRYAIKESIANLIVDVTLFKKAQGLKIQRQNLESQIKALEDDFLGRKKSIEQLRSALQAITAQLAIPPAPADLIALTLNSAEMTKLMQESFDINKQRNELIMERKKIKAEEKEVSIQISALEKKIKEQHLELEQQLSSLEKEIAQAVEEIELSKNELNTLERDIKSISFLFFTGQRIQKVMFGSSQAEKPNKRLSIKTEVNTSYTTDGKKNKSVFTSMLKQKLNRETAIQKSRV